MISAYRGMWAMRFARPMRRRRRIIPEANMAMSSVSEMASREAGKGNVPMTPMTTITTGNSLKDGLNQLMVVLEDDEAAWTGVATPDELDGALVSVEDELGDVESAGEVDDESMAGVREGIEVLAVDVAAFAGSEDAGELVASELVGELAGGLVAGEVVGSAAAATGSFAAAFFEFSTRLCRLPT